MRVVTSSPCRGCSTQKKNNTKKQKNAKKNKEKKQLAGLPGGRCVEGAAEGGKNRRSDGGGRVFTLTFRLPRITS